MERKNRKDGERRSTLAVVPGGTTAKGERESFAELALPVLEDLYRFACRLEGDPEQAQDLLQEALLVALRKFDQLEALGSFRAWASRVLYHVFLNSKRGRREEPLGEVEATGSAWPAEPALDPEEKFLARQRSAALTSALRELPRRQCLAVLLVDLQGFTYAEAAVALEVPPGTVASRVVRGRHTLRRALRSILEGAHHDD